VPERKLAIHFLSREGMELRVAGSKDASNLHELVKLLRKPTASYRYFIPYITLKNTLTRLLIIENLRQHGFQEQRVPDMATIIVNDGLRVFGILLLLGQEHLIERFIDYEELDSKLPFEKEGAERISPLLPSQFWEETQWELCPYNFRTRMHRKIRPKEILPYVEEVRLGEGAGGEIFKCAIAVEQQQFYPNTGVKISPVYYNTENRSNLNRSPAYL
jgi:hypothetical protein